MQDMNSAMTQFVSSGGGRKRINSETSYEINDMKPTPANSLESSEVAECLTQLDTSINMDKLVQFFCNLWGVQAAADLSVKSIAGQGSYEWRLRAMQKGSLRDL